MFEDDAFINSFNYFQIYYLINFFFNIFYKIIFSEYWTFMKKNKTTRVSS